MLLAKSICFSKHCYIITTKYHFDSNTLGFGKGFVEHYKNISELQPNGVSTWITVHTYFIIHIIHKNPYFTSLVLHIPYCGEGNFGDFL